MSHLSLDQIKKLRDKTKFGVMDCRKALEASDGDFEKAEEWLRQKGMKQAEKRADRDTFEGLIEVYSHGGGKTVGLVELLCETDFVARNEEFKKLARELAMQAAAMGAKNTKEFMNQAWIRDEKKTIEQLVKEKIGAIGENIQVGRVMKLELGKK